MHEHGPDHAATFFDEAAGTWDTPEKVKRSQRIAEAIIDRVPLQKGWTLVDYGAGTGQLGAHLASHVSSVVLDDTSAGMRAEAAKRAADEPGTFTVSDHDLSDAPLSPLVDCIVSAMALHHIADTRAVVRNMVDSLRPGGWIALADLDHDPDNTFHDDDHDGHRGIDRAHLMRLLADVGVVDITDRTALSITKPKDGVDYTHAVFLVTGHLKP